MAPFCLVACLALRAHEPHWLSLITSNTQRGLVKSQHKESHSLAKCVGVVLRLKGRKLMLLQRRGIARYVINSMEHACCRRASSLGARGRRSRARTHTTNAPQPCELPAWPASARLQLVWLCALYCSLARDRRTVACARNAKHTRASERMDFGELDRTLANLDELDRLAARARLIVTINNSICSNCESFASSAGRRTVEFILFWRLGRRRL